MRTRPVVRKLGVLAVVWLSIGGCASELQSAAPEDDAVQSSESALELAFSEISDPAGIGTAGERKTRVLVTSAQRYQRLFGHAPPAEVDFAAGDAAIFYSAGVKRTGGYEASVLSVALDRHRLRVTTRLQSPGDDCIVTQALSKPFVLVKVRLTAAVRSVRFRADNTVRDCSEQPPFCGGFAGFPCPDPATQDCIDDPNDDCDPNNGGADCGGICVPKTDACATVRCRAGTVCQVDEQGSAACVAAGPFCGGIAARPCPGIGECIDDPTDSCDPRAGGADCGGVCVCEQTSSCPAGSEFDSSAKVCDCAPADVDVNPCAAVLCPAGTTCELHQGEPTCLSNGSQDCGPSICGAGTVCCNFSCGICTPPDGVCTQQLCP